MCILDHAYTFTSRHMYYCVLCCQRNLGCVTDNLQENKYFTHGDGPAKLSTIPKITGTQASRGAWGMPPKEIFEN